MKITDVKIFKANQRKGVLGYANVVLDEDFIIRGITIVETQKSGRFLSMPSRVLRGTEKRAYRDMCHPLNDKIRKKLTDAVLKAFEEFENNED